MSATVKNKKPAVINLGAGKNQYPVILAAKRLGFSVLAVDRDPHAPGFALSDERLELSTFEAAPIIQALSSLTDRYQMLGVINRSSGPPVLTSAEICQAFGLPGVSPEAARAILHKSELRAACALHGLDGPRCYSASSLAEIDPSSLNFPCILRPSLSLIGKSGISLSSNILDLPVAFANAKAVSLDGMVNIEEYIPGSDISLMAIVKKGQLHPITLIDELNVIDDTQKINTIACVIPSLFSGRLEEERIIALARRIVANFRLDTTAFNMACRCEPGGRPKLIEIHLDLAGDYLYEGLLCASTSVDVLSLIIKGLIESFHNFSDITFTPTAMVFNKSDKEILASPYRIIKAADRYELEDILFSKKRRMHA